MTIPFSFWEAEHYQDLYDYIIVGAGFVGSSAALHLKKLYPECKILVLEQGLLSQGASTKNAGFSCFGSVGELEDDLVKNSINEVCKTVDMRWRGLKKLQNTIPQSEMEYHTTGGWEVFNTQSEFEKAASKINKWNDALREIIGKNTFEIKDTPLNGFYSKAIYNRHEGQLNPLKAIRYLHKQMVIQDIQLIKGVKLDTWDQSAGYIHIHTNKTLKLKSKNLIIATNGFTKKILPSLDVKPARNQVLITKNIEKLTVKGNFHLNKGYIYFRNVGNRILLGGARFLSDKEFTDQYGNTPQIQEYLTKLLNENIIENHKTEIDRWWSGILGVGDGKHPIIKAYDENIYIAVRLGGMGVAIGIETGEKLAELVQNEE